MRHTLFTLVITFFSLAGNAQNQTKPPLNPQLAARLDSIYNDDSRYRLQSIEIEKKAGYESKERLALVDLTNKQDSLNLIKVQAIIAEHGWPGQESIGEKGVSALFLVIQHADLAIQLKYLPLMKDAAAKGNLSASRLAILEDRIAVRQGRKQVYGSQLSGMNQATKHYGVSPIEDPEHVDERRKKAGLIPLAQYLLQWDIIWNVEEHKKIPSFDQQLSLQLDTIFNDNQLYRPQLAQLRKTYGINAKQSKNMLKMINAKDAANQIKMKRILEKYGFPGPAVAGDKGNWIIQFMFLQADTDTQLKYLPKMKQAVKVGNADVNILADVESRIVLLQNKK